jgi:transposase
MTEITRVAIGTSKSVFTLHAVDAQDRAVLRRNLRRQEFAGFFAKLPPVEVAMEACGGSHYWGRTLQAMGHRVQLIPPQYVKPFVKRGKNDRNDAEAISEAAARPGMQSVPVKSAQAQAQAMVLAVRDLLVRQRTQLVNALRGHAAELGLVAPKAGKGLETLRAEIAGDATLPAPAAEALGLLGREIDRIEARLAETDAKLIGQCKANADCRRLSEVPGIGPIGALNFGLRVDATQFKSGRHFAAWLGLVPRENPPAASSGSAGSAGPGMSACDSCWCWARCRSFASPSQSARAPRHGCLNCWIASRARSRRWLWPTRWPALCGPCWQAGNAIGEPRR